MYSSSISYQDRYSGLPESVSRRPPTLEPSEVTKYEWKGSSKQFVRRPNPPILSSIEFTKPLTSPYYGPPNSHHYPDVATTSSSAPFTDYYFWNRPQHYHHSYTLPYSGHAAEDSISSVSKHATTSALYSDVYPKHTSWPFYLDDSLLYRPYTYRNLYARK